MPFQDKIISKEKAKELELKFYFTGKPCKHNHISNRWIHNGMCYECAETWKKNNTDKLKQHRSTYYNSHLEEIREKDREKMLAQWGRKRAKRLQREPNWLSDQQKYEIEQKYWLAKMATLRSGEKHVVDHIVPLNGKIVSGLHVPCNLQVITAKENSKKSDRFIEELADPSYHA